MTTPSVELATRLARLLTEHGLLLPASRDRVAERIAAGEMKQEDWRLEVEKAKFQENSQ